MNKTKLRDVDIFQRTLFCQLMPMPEKEEKIEYLEETDEATKFEADKCFINQEEETIDLKLLMNDLKCMKLKIQNMEHLFKMKLAECPTEKYMDYDEPLSCSKNKELCDLQKNQNMMQCQIKQIVEYLKEVKREIPDLREQINVKNKEISELQKQIAVLMEWKNNLKHEFAKCLERFEFLKHVKAEWSDINDKMEQQQKSFCTLQESLVSKEYFQQANKNFQSAINELKQLVNELVDINANDSPLLRNTCVHDSP